MVSRFEKATVCRMALGSGKTSSSDFFAVCISISISIIHVPLTGFVGGRHLDPPRWRHLFTAQGWTGQRTAAPPSEIMRRKNRVC